MVETITYKNEVYKLVLWNTKAGFNPNKEMYEVKDKQHKIIIVSVNGLNIEIKEFGNYYKKNGSYNWKNIDKALAFMRE